ncbi:aminopeptidase P family protein [Actibacterium sp. 188UL27-1]|uniref:aminopeptidase P family protein n=1 Tax=Actibacterium sp. 188UL27-1 TaxID=2786961 RepID=UPI001956DDE6|nr:aminopeptidase P family protein [Actibacterium sp. 188UL27-1]MBM7069303.1 aminopeptidase P family protein [Actibacterium sp. 188UL27-1]
MFQSFETKTDPSDGPPRLAALREHMMRAAVDAFLVPRADAHQGEYVAPRDERLTWLTGFTGSAGFAAVTSDHAGVFIDGRYRVQVKAQVALDKFTPVSWPEIKLADWLMEHLPRGAIVGFDSWLHTPDEMETLHKATADHGLVFTPISNMIDAIWQDQPAPPVGPLLIQPIEFAGETHDDKRARLAKALTGPAVITLPDSIAWLLNVRGSDIVRNPVPHAFAILHIDGSVDLFIDAAKVSEEVEAHLGAAVRLHGPDRFGPLLDGLTGPVQLDRKSVPVWVAERLETKEIKVQWKQDPCILPKARKNQQEINGMEAAHLRDGVAMAEFLCWLDTEAPSGKLTEIDVVRKLETLRRVDNGLRDISFETIAGAGPNGAIVHYRVTNDTNRPVTPGELLLVDSGGQYLDGTTDITRTVATGPVGDLEKTCFTKVLQGLIAISRVRWPEGLAGRDLDALARFPLWTAGLDYDHGTGHGVGAYLSVHEGPQRLARSSNVPLEVGMCLSNEPGYYREGAFGIRIENLIHVTRAPEIAGADNRKMLVFATLTYVPIDRRLIDKTLMSRAEIDWLNGYHAETNSRLGPRVSPVTQDWLARVTAPI